MRQVPLFSLLSPHNGYIILVLALVGSCEATNCGTYTCPAGSVLKGTPSSITCAGGPPCTSNAANNLLCCDLDCAVATVVGASTVPCTEGGTVISGTVCTWTADTGYTCGAIGPTTCTNGVVTGTVTCAITNCGTFTAAMATANNVALPGSTATCDDYGEAACALTCLTGWTGSPSLSCPLSGTYQVTSPCSPNVCSSAATISNTDANADYSTCNGLTSGTNCVANCNSGYERTNNAIALTCQTNGDFDAQSVTSCTLIVCTAFNPTPHFVNAPTVTTCDDATEGTCALTCLTGYTGALTLDCTGSSNPGTWTVTGTTCTDNCIAQTAASIVPPVGVGLVTGTDVGTCVAGRFTVATPTCSVTACDAGYTAAGASLVTCSAAGVLSAGAGLTCTEATCTAYTLPTGVSIGTCPANLRPVSNPSCTLACSTGYYVASGTTTLSCSTAVLTPSTTLFCDTVKCGNAVDFTLNNAVATTLTVCDQQIKPACAITCLPGYTSAGATTLSCTGANTWTFTNPCTSQSCGVFAFATNHVPAATVVTGCDEVHEGTCTTTCDAGWSGNPILDCALPGPAWTVTNPCTENSCAAYAFPTGVTGGATDPCTNGIVLTSTTDATCNLACAIGYVAATSTLDCASTAVGNQQPTLGAGTLTCTPTCGLHTCTTAFSRLRATPNSVSCGGTCTETICCVGLVISSTTLTTSETGTTATFTLELLGQPTLDVNVPLTHNDGSEGSMTSNLGHSGTAFTLVFTNLNWNTQQTVTVTGLNDALLDGDISYTITIGTLVSGDTDYNGITTPDITVTNLDDEFTATTSYTPSLTTSVSKSVSPTISHTMSSTLSPSLTFSRSNTLTVTTTLSVSKSLSPTQSPTISATPTFTASLTPTTTMSRTLTKSMTLSTTLSPTFSITPTFTPSPTESTTLSPTFSITPSFTPTFTESTTLSPTFSITPSLTVTHTASKTLTQTISKTESLTLTHTASPTLTQTISKTDSLTLTHTASPTLTQTISPTETLTQTPTETVTKTPTPTTTPTITPTKTVTQTLTPTYTETPSPTVSLTLSPTITPTSTITRTITSSLTPTFTVTPTRTATRTVTLSLTPTFSVTPTPTYTRTVTQTLTPTLSMTPTHTFSITPTPTYTLTPTYTVSPTLSLTRTPTYTVTPTDTKSLTLTRTPTFTFTKSTTFTISRTPTFSITPTFSLSETLTLPTATETISATLTLPTATETISKTLTLPSATETFSPTFTLRTPTNTLSITFTLPTATETLSPTISISSTRTNTGTDTLTLTESTTQTLSESISVTETVTLTQTLTIPITPTETFTKSATASRTFTFSLSPTHSLTDTLTVSIPIPTPTRTFTFTHSSSHSETFTPTLSLSETTGTATLSGTVSPTPFFSRTSATTTDSLVYSVPPEGTRTIREPRVKVGDLVVVESNGLRYGQVVNLQADGNLRIRASQTDPAGGVTFAKVYPFRIFPGDKVKVRDASSQLWADGNILGKNSEDQPIVDTEGSLGTWQFVKPDSVSPGEYVAARRGLTDSWVLGRMTTSGRVETTDGAQRTYSEVIQTGFKPGDPVRVSTGGGFTAGVVDRIQGGDVFVFINGVSQTYPKIVPYVLPPTCNIAGRAVIQRNVVTDSFVSVQGGDVTVASGEILVAGAASSAIVQMAGPFEGTLAIGGTATTVGVLGLLVPGAPGVGGMRALTPLGGLEVWSHYYSTRLSPGATVTVDAGTGTFLGVNGDNAEVWGLGTAALLPTATAITASRGMNAGDDVYVRDTIIDGWRRGTVPLPGVARVDVPDIAGRRWRQFFPAVLFSTDVVLARDVNSEKWQVGTVNFPPVTTPGSFAPPTVQTAPTSAPRAYGQVERVGFATDESVWVRDTVSDTWAQGIVIVPGGAAPTVGLLAQPGLSGRVYSYIRPAEVTPGDYVVCRDEPSDPWVVGEITRVLKISMGIQVNVSGLPVPRVYKQVIPKGFRNPKVTPAAGWSQSAAQPTAPLIKEKAFVRDSAVGEWSLGDVEENRGEVLVISKVWTFLQPPVFCRGDAVRVRDHPGGEDSWRKGAVSDIIGGVPFFTSEASQWTITEPAGYRKGDTVLVKDRTDSTWVTALVTKTGGSGGDSVIEAAAVSGSPKTWDFIRPDVLQSTQRVLVRDNAFEPWEEGIVTDGATGLIRVTENPLGDENKPYKQVLPLGYRPGDVVMVGETNTGPFMEGRVASSTLSGFVFVTVANGSVLHYPHVHPVFTREDAGNLPLVVVKDEETEPFRLGFFTDAASTLNSEKTPLVQTFASPWVQFKTEADFQANNVNTTVLTTAAPPVPTTEAPFVTPDPTTVTTDKIVIKIETNCADLTNATCFNMTEFKLVISEELKLEGCGATTLPGNGADIVNVNTVPGDITPKTPTTYLEVSFDDCPDKGWTGEQIAENFNSTIIGDPKSRARVEGKGYKIIDSRYIPAFGKTLVPQVTDVPANFGGAGTQSDDDDSIPWWPFLLAGILCCCLLCLLLLCGRRNKERRDKDQMLARDATRDHGLEMDDKSDTSDQPHEKVFLEPEPYTVYPELDVVPSIVSYPSPEKQSMKELPGLDREYTPPEVSAFDQYDKWAEEGRPSDGVDVESWRQGSYSVDPLDRPSSSTPTRAGPFSRVAQPPGGFGRGNLADMMSTRKEGEAPGDNRDGQRFPVVI